MSSSSGTGRVRRASRDKLVSVPFEPTSALSAAPKKSTNNNSNTTTPPSGDQAVILGKHYHLDNAKEKELFSRHCQSFFRYSYRRGFPALFPYSISSDSGWGCMLRAAQSMLAHVYCRHFLGPDWRYPSASPAPEDILKQSPSYCNILNWFLDYPGYPHHYSIHHMVQAAMSYDKLPGEWHGPSTAAFVLRDLCRNHCQFYEGQLTVFVTPTDTIYISEIERSCSDASLNTTLRNLNEQKAHSAERGLVSIDSMLAKRGHGHDASTETAKPRGVRIDALAELADVPSLTDMESIFDFAYNVNLQDVTRLTYLLDEAQKNPSADTDSASRPKKSTSDPLQVDTDSFYDPLCRPPPSQVQPWLTSLLLIVPLMLGMHNINPEHIEELRQVLDCPDCVGLLGGRPNHAIYFTGYLQQEKGDPKALLLYGHDPHTTFSAIEQDLLQTPGIVPPPRELLEQLHTKQHTCNGLHISSLDSSLAIGFYFRDREHFHGFCTEWRAKAARGFKLFNIQQHMPEYMRETSAGGSAQTVYEDNVDLLMDEPALGTAQTGEDKDEDYVFL